MRKCFWLLVSLLAPAGNMVAAEFKPAKIPVLTTQMGAYSDIKVIARPGFVTEILAEISKRAKLDFDIAQFPWKRALVDVETSKKPMLIYPLIRSPQRENEYAWIVKAINDRMVFWSLVDGPKIESLNDLKKYRIGVIRGSPFERQLMALKLPNIDVATDTGSNARKLVAKRIDLWFVTVNTAMDSFKNLQLNKNEFRVAYTLGRTGVYVAGNKDFPAATAEKIRVEFEKLKTEGWYGKLLEKYDLEDAGEEPGASALNPVK